MDIFIPNKCIADREFHINKNQLYLLIKLFHWGYNDKIIINKKVLFKMFSIKDNNRTFKNAIVESFLDICYYFNLFGDWEDVEVDKFKNGNTIIIDLKSLHEYRQVDRVNYSILQEGDFNKLELIRDKRKRYSAVNVYCFLLFRTFGKKSCYPPYEDICSKLNITDKTLTSSLELLKELGMIVFGNRGYVKGKMQKHNNYYFIVSRCTNINEANRLLEQQIAKK